ncbi:MAG: hypothetical protein AAGB22_09570 [Bacteroidota bacterium]
MANTLRFEKKTYNLPDDEAECTQWQVYHKTLEREFGKHHARTIWLDLWSREGRATCLTNSGFNQWQKKAGLNVGGAGFDMLNKVQDIGTDFLGMTGTIGKALKWGVPAILVLVVLHLSVRAFRPNAGGGSGVNPLMLLPQVRGAKMLGALK